MSYDRRGPRNPKWRGGVSSHPLYRIWQDMKSRCRTPSHHRYKDYGGRGITVDPRWDDFWVFVADMGPRPNDVRHVMDRIDNDGSYTPENCRWTTYSVSAINRRRHGHEGRVRGALGRFV